ncbi:hypothetical protein ACH5RR_032023 [Cinchona calisaya]|uniref:Uncharacterized protein n=1 Tax=Cinchona calisaya TaxID=153742 RepID=A0ABD2YI94_9GENT
MMKIKLMPEDKVPNLSSRNSNDVIGRSFSMLYSLRNASACGHQLRNHARSLNSGSGKVEMETPVHTPIHSVEKRGSNQKSIGKDDLFQYALINLIKNVYAKL